MTSTVDVAIVGLGPVGATLAALLGRAGVSTVVIDKADDIFPLPRAIGFDHEIMRVLQNLGLAETIAPFVVSYRPTEYRGVDGRAIARYASLPPPFPQGWEPSFVFTQPPVERALRALLETLPAVEVRLSTELTGIIDHGDRVELRTRDAAGAPGTVRARYAVGCDGGTSLVRKLLDIRFESLDFDEPWLVVDMLVNEDKLGTLPETIIQYCDPQRPTTFVIGPDNHRRWELMLLPGEVPEVMSREETIWRLLERWLSREDASLWRAATYVFHALVAEEWRKGRVFLAGDAAHMTPPFMAQGMCQGIRDAANLAWKLTLVLSGKAGDALLDSYQAERRLHVRATTETAKALGRIICERDLEKAKARDVRMRAELGDPPRVQVRQNLIPPLTAGAFQAGLEPPVGTRFPQPRITRDGGVERLDDVAGDGFRLVLAASVNIADLPSALRQVIADLGAQILCLSQEDEPSAQTSDALALREADGLLAGWLREHGVIAAFVRPDHYVFAAARTRADLKDMASQISTQLHLEPATAPAG